MCMHVCVKLLLSIELKNRKCFDYDCRNNVNILKIRDQQAMAGETIFLLADFADHFLKHNRSLT